jgi:ABC-type multidrug transport system ATPase subunit
MTATGAPASGQIAPGSPPRRDPAAMPALSVGGVSHSYGPRRALIDIDFNVAPASFTALLGLNGAGKSTLFALVTRLFGIQTGRISIFGHDIARALLHRPRLLLLDEATVGLDVKARAEIISHVRQLVAEQGIGVLWATHLFDEIKPSDDLVVLHQGRVLAQGEVARVIADAGAQDVNSAFMRLTGAATESGKPAP